MKQALRLLLRPALIALGLLVLISGLGTWLHYETSWPRLAVVLLGTTAVEGMIRLQSVERRRLSPRHTGLLLGLRIAALLLTLGILLEPALLQVAGRDIDRSVVVLLDDSASMQLTDESASLDERLALAQLFDPDLVSDQPEQSVTNWFKRLDPIRRTRIHTTATQPRAAAARHLLAAGERPLLTALHERYDTRLLRFAREPIETPVEPWLSNRHTNLLDEAFRAHSDLGTALNEVLATVPSAQLAGILILSDGRPNGKAIDRARQQLAANTIPVCSVLIGSEVGLRDAAIVDLHVPDAVHIGDPILIQADLKFSGLAGQTATVILRDAEDRALETRHIQIHDALTRLPIEFEHHPEDKSIAALHLEIAPLEEERLLANNEWAFEVAVTDDQIHVLLVDRVPRWEFRYLRNLLQGRDKSVHLQYVLLQPDKVQGQAERPVVHASAARPFGQAEATALPAKAEDWLAFDAIILGDIDSQVIDEAAWSNIHRAVTERGSLLVTIAGPHAMPARHVNPLFRELAPIEPGSQVASTNAVRFRPTAIGRDHPILQMDPEPFRNQEIWDHRIPALYWHHPARAKPTAEVLAATASGDPLLVVQQAGSGKVASLLTDRTWRFRYRAGDIWHHAFWGQLIRWGAGQSLRAGNDQVRLGTDQLVYTADDPIHVEAQISDADQRSIVDDTITIEVYGTNASSPLLQQTLDHEAGRYRTTLPPTMRPGRYRLVLDSQWSPEPVETSFSVVQSKTPIEWAELSADPAPLRQLAEATGGALLSYADAHRVLDRFGAPTDTLLETRTLRLWDTWPIFVIFLALVGSEWILRRQQGLP